MNDDIIEIHAVIRGYVQGVGFRYTACKEAERFDILGTVRNVANGDVEIYAQGKRDSVHEFLDTLSGSRSPGRVMSVHSEEVKSLHHYSEFRIIS